MKFSWKEEAVLASRNGEPMNKLWTLDAIPSFIAAALMGSGVTAYLLIRPGAPGLVLLALPIFALGMDQYFKRLEFQAPQPAAQDLFSYAPRIGFSLVVLAGYSFDLWLATAPKDWEPYLLYSKLAVFVMCIGLIALGSTMGRMKPRKHFGNSWVNKSSLAFRKTARLKGWTFVVTGVLALAINWWDALAAKYFILGAMVLATPLSYGYSYYVWKHDPDRTPVPVKS
jgi:hypothetical protein